MSARIGGHEPDLRCDHFPEFVFEYQGGVILLKLLVLEPETRDRIINTFQNVVRGQNVKNVGRLWYDGDLPGVSQGVACRTTKGPGLRFGERDIASRGEMHGEGTKIMLCEGRELVALATGRRVLPSVPSVRRPP